MACNTCGPEVQGQCDACKLVDGDERFKNVFLCETCNAYLCADCSTNWSKRAQAAAIDIHNKITKYLNLKFGKGEEPVTTVNNHPTIEAQILIDEVKKEIDTPPALEPNDIAKEKIIAIDDHIKFTDENNILS